MQNTIYVLEGSYRNKLIENQSFQLLKPYQPHPHKEGGYITVKVDPKDYPGATSDKIKVNVVSESQLRDSAPEQPKEESDTETVERMRKRFTILDSMTKACKKGDVRAMIVSGPPGVGKSFGVEQVLNENRMFDKMAGKRDRFQVIKGASSAIGLYKVLYENSDKGSVLVMDDCDTVLHDETSLNLLKAALDSGAKRMLSWNTDSALLRREGIPDRNTFTS